MKVTENSATGDTGEPIIRDGRAYSWAAFVLRAGMYISFTLMAVGLLWWVVAGSPGGQAANGQVLALDRIMPELARGNPLAVLNLGMLLLIATPVTTLIAAMVAFLLEGNRRYAGIAAFVVFILLLSITISSLGLDKAFQSWLVNVVQGG